MSESECERVSHEIESESMNLCVYADRGREGETERQTDRERQRGSGRGRGREEGGREGESLLRTKSL